MWCILLGYIAKFFEPNSFSLLLSMGSFLFRYASKCLKRIVLYMYIVGCMGKRSILLDITIGCWSGKENSFTSYYAICVCLNFYVYFVHFFRFPSQSNILKNRTTISTYTSYSISLEWMWKILSCSLYLHIYMQHTFKLKLIYIIWFTPPNIFVELIKFIFCVIFISIYSKTFNISNHNVIFRWKNIICFPHDLTIYHILSGAPPSIPTPRTHTSHRTYKYTSHGTVYYHARIQESFPRKTYSQCECILKYFQQVYFSK